jgi:23S rRNA (adenine2503-C2)-methyltransferase
MRIASRRWEVFENDGVLCNLRMIMDSIYNIQALERVSLDPHRQKLFLNALCKKGLPLDVCLEKAPELGNKFCFQSLELIDRHDSKRDGATKLVFRTLEAGHRVEAVILRIATGRTSLCISSQVGCAANCQFCATGGLGFTRNLTADEMLDQVRLARELLHGEGRTLRNVVVMGMGEPLHNEEALFHCLERLRDIRFFNFSENHLLVSTVGVPDAMERFAERFPNIRLALSLHSARQEVRERLMPVSRAYTLDMLKNVLPEKLMIEILLLKGINDSPEELSAIIEFLSEVQAHINLIQFNPYPGAIFEPVSGETREAFGEKLRAAGFKTTLRYSLGDDIAAACGQLAGGSSL